MKKGIAFAGSIITDIVKTIDRFPQLGMLSNISDVSRSVGGCVPNTAIDLKKIDSSLPVSVYGCVGDDANGEFVIDKMRALGINTDGVAKINGVPTAFSDVMSLKSGERTFFCASGANALFSPEYINAKSINADILHFGYIMLLDKFDEFDPEYGTVLARFLSEVQKCGIKTSIDAVSDENGDYASKIRPVLPYCDYVIINEIECCRTWNINCEKNGKLDIDAVERAMRLTLEAGVKSKVIVHSKGVGFVLDKSGTFTAVPSLDIPKDEIKGSVGAGDAFCAGALYALGNAYSDTELLEFASAAAACNLFCENSVDGMRSHEETERVMNGYPRKKL